MNTDTRKALELARAALEWPAEHYADTAIATKEPRMTITYDSNGHAYETGPCPTAACELNPCTGKCKKRRPDLDRVDPAAPVAQDAETLAREAHGYIREQMTAWDRENLHDCIDKLAGIEIPKSAPAAPVAWLRNLTDAQPHAVRDLRYRSVTDVDNGVEYVPVYVAPVAQRVNLNDRAVQRRLAAQWGFVEPPAAPVAQPLTDEQIKEGYVLSSAPSSLWFEVPYEALRRMQAELRRLEDALERADIKAEARNG